MDKPPEDKMVVPGHASFALGRFQHYSETWAGTVTHVTPEAATAMIRVEEAKRDAAIAQAAAASAVAKSTSEVPAEEETKRAKQVSYRQYAATTCAVVLALVAWAAGLKDDNLVKVWVSLAALAATERTLTTVLAPKKKVPELPAEAGVK